MRKAGFFNLQRQRTLRSFIFAAAVLCSPARVPAWAAFTAPLDPDFPPETKEEEQQPAPSPAPAPESETSAPLLLPAGGNFLLLERPDRTRIFEQPLEPPAPPEPRDFLEFQEKLRAFEYAPEKWRTMRANVESGREPSDGGIVEYVS